MVKILDGDKPEREPEDVIEAKFRQFVWLKREVESLGSVQSGLKSDLLQALEALGEEDDKGHLWFEFPSPVEGYAAMQRQRRVSQKLDEEAAEEILTAKGLTDRCYKTVRVLDEDEVMALLYEGVLTEADVDQMFPKTISYAFVPSKSR